MNRKISNFLKKYSVDVFKVDRLIVSTFIILNKITVVNNLLIKEHLILDSDSGEIVTLNKFIKIVIEEKHSFEIEDLIELFEFVISPADKEVNGAVYTPKNIRLFIVNKILSEIPNNILRDKKFADISCGCGGFFYTLAQSIRERIQSTFYYIYKNNIFGVDIESYSIIRTKLLLSLFAISQGEDVSEFDFNLFVANSLDFDWRSVDVINENGGFDAIIGNPPYVGSSKIDQESKALLGTWSVSKTGKPDLYIPFFQIGIENLNVNGILGYITVNNFYRSLNGRGIRSYLSEHKYSILIIDFGSEQIFRGRSTYTCVCIIHKNENGFISYIKSPSNKIEIIKDNEILKIDYQNLSNHDGWLLQNNSVSKNINQIESIGQPLGKCFNIRNGFATLRNDIFLFTPIREDEVRFYFEQNGVGFWIEKDICRDAIKPNTLKHEKELSYKTEKLIFPYKSENELFCSNKKVQLIKESQLRETYSLAYEYLLTQKDELKNRDKGNREYEAWYAFGRSQAINIYGYKLLFPYISDCPCFVYTDNKDLLFYNGYALISDNEEDLLVAQKVLKSKVFWYYIKHTSKPYGGNYYALAKNYVNNFGMYNFNKNQRAFLINTNSQKEIDDFLIELYGIDI